MPKHASKSPTVAELFAGVGGFRIGLEKSGWKINWSNQWEPSTKFQHASSCYVRNFGDENHFNQDINEIVTSMESGDIPVAKVDLVVGGFPCQDYSVAKTLRASEGLHGKKGVLWWPLLKFIQLSKPKFVLLENVDRLLKSPSNQPGRDFAIMLRTLSNLGYQIEWRVINAADYGFPQRRKRVFILASRKKRQVNPEKYVLEKSVLARALPVNQVGELKRFLLKGSVWKISKSFSLGLKKSPFENSGFFDGQQVTTFKTVSSYKGKYQTLGEHLLPLNQIPEEFWIPKSQLSEWRFLKGSKAIPRKSKSGHKYLYSEGSMSFPDPLDKPSRTILTAEGGSSPSRFRHVIQDKHGHRRLTPVELERLSGFPDEWTRWSHDGKEFSAARRSFFVGNALVVGVIARIGRELMKEIRGGVVD